jgi:excisionase family DNA binding protein
MNIKELSEYLGTPKGSIYTMVCLKKIPPACVIKLGRALRFEKEGIDKWITELRSSPTQL